METSARIRSEMYTLLQIQFGRHVRALFPPGKAPKERAAPSLRLAKGAPNNLRKPHQRFVLSSFSFICVLGNSLTLLQLSVSVNLSSWIHSSLGTRALLSTVK